jgi:uncharacterized membrane protein YdjX (TVP38/TMEM64 family)
MLHALVLHRLPQLALEQRLHQHSYAPGGVLFGGFWGGLLSLSGNVAGAGIACQLTRVLIGERAEKYLARSALAPYEARITRSGMWVIFLLRVNPLTSSDLVSYAAGLTHLAVWKVMLATLAGMAPLCFAQAYLAEGLLAAFPRLVYPLVAACAVYALVVVWVLTNLLKKIRPMPSVPGFTGGCSSR